MPFIDQLAQQTAGNVVGAGMGLILGGIERKNQLKQQGKLQAQQIQGQKELTDYNYGKQMQMWNDTNYKAQMEQLKKTGLNPGLIYGMSGGGGQSTNIAQGNVGAAQARQGGEAAGMGIAMGQTAMMAAQIELTKAQTENVKTQTANLPLQGQNIAQNTQSQKAQQALTEAETVIKNIESTVKGATQNAAISQILKMTEKIANDTEISNATKQDTISRIKAEAIGALIQNALGEQKTAESKATITKMAGDLINTSRDLDIKQRAQIVNEWVETVKANFPGIGNVLGRSLNDLIENIIGHSTGGSRPTQYEPPKK